MRRNDMATNDELRPLVGTLARDEAVGWRQIAVRDSKETGRKDPDVGPLTCIMHSASSSRSSWKVEGLIIEGKTREKQLNSLCPGRGKHRREKRMPISTLASLLTRVLLSIWRRSALRKNSNYRKWQTVRLYKSSLRVFIFQLFRNFLK